MAAASNRRGRSGRGRFTIEEIHRSLFVSPEAGSALFTVNTAPEAGASGALAASGSTPFNDALHEYSLFARPKQMENIGELAKLVSSLVCLCGTSVDHWKVFLLVTFHRRYHARAPAAGKSQEEGESSEDVADGDGERLIFYVTCLVLRRILHICDQKDKPSDEENVFSDLVGKAVQCMIEVAPQVGGTRDINAMVEHMCFERLERVKILSVEDPEKPKDSDTFKSKLLAALESVLLDQSGDVLFDMALSKAALLLDNDLAKCAEQQDQSSVLCDELMSTIHVTLPHRDRGNREGSAWQRNIGNSVAEVLIWRKTKAASTEERFSRALDELRESFLQHSGDKRRSQSGAYDCVLRMQTTARKKRKLLNDHAREQGFLLCSRYLMDRTALSFRQLRRGKAGDLAKLQALASKFRDTRVLKMISRRNADPAKASCVDSVGSLVSGWRDIHAPIEEGSIEELELQIQKQTVQATIEKLRSRLGKTEEERTVLVAKIGRSKKDAACAILVAAALQPRSRLLLGGEERDVSEEEVVMELLNSAILEEADSSDEKSVCDILKEEFDDVVFLSSTDIELDEVTLQQLQKQGRTIRVHSTSRVDKVEPVTVELKDEINEKLRAGSAVSVAVLLDCTGSMGCEISGCKKGALKMIELFNDLAPVRWANFIGYWDPIGSRGDPDPRSCGFLDPGTEGSLDEIQTFVNTKLPCTGGGDEPEDIPAALEKLLHDIKTAGISADDGVHFVFFIADAGYRPNESVRVSSLLTQLADFGVIMVMCPVRSYGTCVRLVEKNKETFHPGQYIELGGVSELESIAAAVTESIRASLFQHGNVASVTASVGETLEALGQLCNFQKDHASLKRVEELAKMPPEPTDDEVVPEDTAEEKEKDDEKEEDMSVSSEDSSKTSDGKDEEASGPAPVFSSAGKFSLTNMDRIYLSISRLPKACHEAVEDAFGGKSLENVVAANVANRLVDEGISVSDLRRSGYPAETVELVRKMMGGHGVKRVEVD